MVILVLVWLAAFVLSCAAVWLHVIRHRTKGLAMAFLCPVGGAMMYGFLMAAVGLAEGFWRTGSSGLWTILVIAILGLILEVFGWRAVLRPRTHVGHCRGCGYDLAGLSTCPECGRPASLSP
jgi:hypothetical protein